MRNFLILHFIITTFLLQSCTPPLIQYTPFLPPKETKPTTQSIYVFEQNDPLPKYATILGEIYIGDTGFSTGCDYDTVINLAIERARTVGGDAIQIIEVNTPDFWSTCYRIKAKVITIEAPKDWPIVSKTESEIRQYLDENADSLNPIEGIWTITESGSWRNVLSGISGSLPRSSPYRLAIIKNTTIPNYDFIAIVLESEYSNWTPGRVKAYFRKTAYEKVYEGLWFMADYSQQRGNYVLDDSGLIENVRTTYDQQYIELTFETIFIKAHPPLTGKLRPSLDKKAKTSGSGFLLTANGLVVTNFHVIEDADKIEVVFPERNIIKAASVKIKDIKNDIAILEVKDFSYSDISTQPIPFVFTDVNSVKIGQTVFTLGFPLEDIMGSKPRLSAGHINSLYGIQDDPRLLQISNPLQPGNSGGPLFNSKGELVGIVLASLNAKYFYEKAGIIPQNVNFAIKINYLQNLLSMVPDGDEIFRRKNSIKQTGMENQVEQLNPFIVQVSAY